MASTRIAAVQASPVFLDLEATIAKGCRLIEEAAAAGATLVVFPEAFVPGYPLWVWFIPSGHTHPLRTLYAELHRNSPAVPGPALAPLLQAAGDCRVTVAVGVNERNAEASDATLYNTLVYISAEGRILGRHRKFIPTAGERLVWGQGPEMDLRVFETPAGRVGGLICWENYMPLARYALAAEGEQIHVAPTWDRGEPWTSTLRHVAKEGRCFVVGACQAFHKDDIPDRLAFKAAYLAGVEGWINPGASCIVDPDGKIVAGPLDGQEGIVYADIEPHQLVGPRWQLDIAGHYARPDLFQLHLRTESRSLTGDALARTTIDRMPPPSLTARERAHLKARAHALEPVVHIGHGGATEGVVAEIDKALEAHELIKIRAGDADRDERDALFREICERTGAVPVQRVGKVLALWRRRTEAP